MLFSLIGLVWPTVVRTNVLFSLNRLVRPRQIKSGKADDTQLSQIVLRLQVRYPPHPCTPSYTPICRLGRRPVPTLNG
eukprot:2354363-Pyramimonas_sp.AAC.1